MLNSKCCGLNAFVGLGLRATLAQNKVEPRCPDALLGGSWVVISRVISPLSWVISIVTLIITPFIIPHEPPKYLDP